jgi:hypothetical protein
MILNAENTKSAYLQITFPIFTAPNTTGSNHLYNTLELLMMGIMVPETCWANNKICNKNHLLHLVGILFPHIRISSTYGKYPTVWLFTRISYVTVVSMCCKYISDNIEVVGAPIASPSFCT